MDEKKMDVYPIHHKNLLFSIITHLDLTFKEVREMLDHLLEQKAFQDGEDWETGPLYCFSLGSVEYEVGVSGYEVVVYRRDEKMMTS